MTPCERCCIALPAGARFCPNCGHPVRSATAATVDPAALHAVAPPSLTRKMRGPRSGGQRKPVTALFADVVGSTSILESVDPEDWSDVMNRAFEVMSRAVFRYEGTIAQLMGDGLLAFFGAPVAHEDDPERAVRAGLDMLCDLGPLHEELVASRGIDFRIRIGINTGPVIVGPVGSDLKYEYTAIGDPINVAARIQGLARPDSVLITDVTRRHVAAKFDLAEVGSLDLKGKSRPVLAYEVLGVREVPRPTRGLPGFTSPMVGRDDALHALGDVLARASERRGAAAFVIGEPGIGKTRLVTELRGSAGAVATMWAEGRGISYGRNVPYGLLIELVAELVDAGTPARLSDRDAALIDHLLGRLDDTRAALVTAVEPEVLQNLYVASLEELLRLRSGHGPVVALCEDVHWADQASVDVLSRLFAIAADAAVVFVCTTRPDRDVPGWRLIDAAERRGDVAVTRVMLEPLDETSSRRMVGDLLEIESLPERLRNSILTRAAGNPFFVEEVIRMMIERGAIERRDGKWVATRQVLDVDIPDTIHGLLLSRIDRLSDAARHAVRVAAVVGRNFDRGLLDEVLTTVAGRRLSDEEVDQLTESGLIVPAGGEYMFRHVLIQDAAYGSLLKQDRRTIHGAVAALLETRLETSGPGAAALVAEHYERAGEVQRAIPHLLDAGRHALETFATAEAYEFFSRVERYLPDWDDVETRRRRVEAAVGKVEAGMTFIPAGEQIEALEPLVAAAERLGDFDLVEKVHYWIVRNRHARAELAVTSPALQRSIERVLEIAAMKGDDHLRGGPLALVGESKFVERDYRAAVDAFEQAVPLLAARGSVKEAAYWSGWLAISYARLGDFDKALPWLPRGRELAARSGDPVAIMDADLHSGMVETLRGNLDDAVGLVRRGIELAEQLNNKECLLVGLYVEGEQHLQLGKPELALEPLEKATEVAQYCDMVDVENLSRAMLGLARSQSGISGRSLAEIDDALAKAREIGDRLTEGEVLRARAVVLAADESPDWEAVEADFEASVSLFERLGTRPYLARALRDYGLALEAVGRVFDGKEKLEEAERLFTAMGVRH